MKLSAFFRKKRKELSRPVSEEVSMNCRVAEKGDSGECGKSERTEVIESIGNTSPVQVKCPEEPQWEKSIMEEYDPTSALPKYIFPAIDLLEDMDVVFSTDEVIETKDKIIQTLQANKINVRSLETTVGYTNTLYEIIPPKGVRLSQVKNLHADLSFDLGASDISIEPLFDRGSIGVIVPNKEHVSLPIRSMMESAEFIHTRHALPLIIGQTLTHKNIIIDLSEKGHVLVSGATGQGKSVLLNVIIASLLYKRHPSELKFVLMDPIRIELSLYSMLEKHFLAKLPDGAAVVSDKYDALCTLESLTLEMDDRLRRFSEANVRSIKEYNARFRKRTLNPSKGHRFMPYIVVVMDKYFDLVMTEGESYIRNLVGKAHFAGIHLILSVQRPSYDVIAEDIKSNFPVRIAFRTASMRESRMILDEEGAERLAGNGDAIYKDELSKIRMQVPFISTLEVRNITRYIVSQQGFDSAYPLRDGFMQPTTFTCDLTDKDVLFEESARLIVVHQQGSTSLIQRKFSIGYSRAGRIMNQLEFAGIVGAVKGSTPREVFISDEYSLEKLLDSLR